MWRKPKQKQRPRREENILCAGVYYGIVVGKIQFNKWQMRANWGNFVQDSKKLTAYAMNSEEERWESPVTKNSPLFHGNPIVSQKTISNSKDIEQLKQMVLSLDGNYRPVAIAACEPTYRHGIRFEKDGKKVEAIMCFFCGESIVFDTGGGTHHAYVDGKWLKTLNTLVVAHCSM